MRVGAALGALTLVASGAAGADQAQSFVPKGWVQEWTVDGDLNGDRRPDRVLVIRKDDPSLRIRNEGLGNTELDTNPRRLVVLVRTGSNFAVAATNDTVIPPIGDTDNPCLADPLGEGGIDIARGSLRITLSTWLSCGSYGVSQNTYAFRLDGRRLRLIGFDRLDYSRASGEGERLSANFLTGRYSKTTGLVIAGDQPERPRAIWRPLAKTPVFSDTVRFGECLDVERRAGFC